MKNMKVKFHNKKKKIAYSSHCSTEDKDEFNRNSIDFLLRENTDTQQAKNELRKVSEQIVIEHLQSDKQLTWHNDRIKEPLSWLDMMNGNQVKNVVSGKIGIKKDGCKNKEDKNLGFWTGVHVIKQNKQDTVCTKQQNYKSNKFIKKSSFLTSLVEEYNETERNQLQPICQPKMNTQGDKSKKSSQGNIEELSSSQQIYRNYVKSTSKNRSTPAIKHRARVVLITPTIKDHSQPQTPSSFQLQPTQPALSTHYFKIPQFNKSKLKRAETVHSDSHGTRNHHHQFFNKTNFYHKKTNTICVFQKKIDDSNKCISFSQYKEISNRNKLYNSSNSVSNQSVRNSHKCRVLSSEEIMKNKVNYQNIHNNNSNNGNSINGNNQNNIINSNGNNVCSLEQLSKMGHNFRAELMRIEMEKAAKTMMLKQQFERLRKLMKKQTKPQFQVQRDMPMKILML